LKAQLAISRVVDVQIRSNQSQMKVNFDTYNFPEDTEIQFET